MISNLEDDFIAVRVQDPRIQNEGSWNSFVDYKIFLHTNSKAFTAKTSCVRRRYSEFVWLKKQLQKNAGLVPVPALPTKSFFYFNNEDFLEGRRKGLQAFLEKVVHMTVCLSDSQLHLFLQTQLPVGHIQDCVQGHTPYSVTDAILDYASSNQGFAQAQENDPNKESSLTISYESMESPVPHQPCQPNKGPFSCELMPCTDSDPVEGLLQPSVVKAMVELQHKKKSSISVLQKNNHLEAMVEECGETGLSFFLGDDQDGPERLTLTAQTRQMSSQIQAPIEVHWTGTGFEENCELEEGSLREESVTVDTEEKTATDSDTEKHPDHHGSSEEANSVDILDFKYRHAGSQEDVLEDDGTENQVLENHACCDVNGLEHVADVSCLEEVKKSEGGTESQSQVNALIESDIQEENHSAHSVPQLESSDDDTQPAQEVDLVGPNEDRHSLVSSNESIIKVSDEESICDEAEDLIQDENHYMKEIHLWSDVDDSSRNILDLPLKGCCEEVDGISTQEEVQQAEELQTNTSITDLSQSVDLSSTVIGGDQTENSDFSIIETRYLPGNS